MRTYNELESACARKGYKWFIKPYSLNFIWERTSYVATNIFDDFLHICYTDEQSRPHVFTIPATTKPGLKGSLLEPITVFGVTGTAIIESGQYLEAWEFRDTFTGFTNYPYFRQIGKLNYWRDANKDRIIDKVQRQVAKLFGTHWHKMSNKGQRGSGLVNNWSLGCMGATVPEWDKILPLVRKATMFYGPKFTGTIIDTSDI